MTAAQIIPIVVIVIVLGIRLWRTGKARAVTTRGLLLVPLIISTLILASVFFLPHPDFTLISFLAIGAAIVLGICAGFARAKTMKLWWDADQKKVMAQASKLAVLFIVVLIIGKSLMRQSMGADSHAFLAIDALMLFGASMILTQAVELSIRARRLVSANPLAGE